MNFLLEEHKKIWMFITLVNATLPRQSIKNNSDRSILFKQTLRDVQSMYYDIGAFDMV